MAKQKPQAAFWREAGAARFVAEPKNRQRLRGSTAGSTSAKICPAVDLSRVPTEKTRRGSSTDLPTPDAKHPRAGNCWTASVCCCLTRTRTNQSAALCVQLCLFSTQKTLGCLFIHNNRHPAYTLALPCPPLPTPNSPSSASLPGRLANHCPCLEVPLRLLVAGTNRAAAVNTHSSACYASDLPCHGLSRLATAS